MIRSIHGAEKRAIIYFKDGPIDIAHRTPIKLQKGAIIFGREKGDIILNDPEISSSHCQIQFVKTAYYIFDMNSSNGTHVNGKKVVKTQLNSDDEIRIGSTILHFKLEDQQDVKHVTNVFDASKEKLKDYEKTSIVNLFVENERKHDLKWKLNMQVKYASGLVETFAINRNLIYLGRATSFGRFEDDAELSRRHLMIKLNNQGDIFIEDQSSTNGTFLNDERIEGIHLVKPQDLVKIGKCFLTFSASQA